MKRMMILIAAVALTAALAVTAAAEYVACLPGEEHVMRRLEEDCRERGWFRRL